MSTIVPSRRTNSAKPSMAQACGVNCAIVCMVSGKTSIGAMAPTCVDVADRLVGQGYGVTVVDPRWVKPVDPALVDLAREHRLVVSIEDNGVVGGCGAVLLQTLNAAGVDTPVRLHGIPQEFLDHAKRPAILERIGLTPQAIALSVVEEMSVDLPAETTAAASRSGEDG